MFGAAAFESIPLILVGALLFSALFEVILMLGEFVLFGDFAATPATVGIGVVAFLGYTAVGLLIRRKDGEAGKRG